MRYRWDDFGAAGDGVTNDTARLQAMLDAARGEPVFLRPGRRHLVTSLSVSAGTRIVGPGATLVQATLDELDGRPLMRLLGDGVRVEGLTFDGRAASQPADGFSDSFDGGAAGQGRSYRAAICGDGVSRLRVVECTFTGLCGAGVALRNASHVRVTDCEARDTYFELYFHHGVEQQADHRIVGNRMSGIGTGHATVNANAAICSNTRGFRFEGNDCDGVERNLLKSEGNEDFVIRGNTVRNVSVEQFAGIQIAGDSRAGVVAGNVVRSAGRGIAVNTPSVYDLVVAKNVISDIEYDGILFGAQENPERFLVEANDLSEIGRHGIHLAGGGSNARVEGNLIVSAEGGAGSAIRVVLLDTSSEALTISRNLCNGFWGATGGVGAISLKQSGSGVYTAFTLRGNEVYTGNTSRIALRADDATDYIAGLLEKNILDGATLGSHAAATWRENDVAGADGFTGAS